MSYVYYRYKVTGTRYKTSTAIRPLTTQVRRRLIIAQFPNCRCPNHSSFTRDELAPHISRFF